MIVTLTPAEMMSAATVGAMRRITSLQKGYETDSYYHVTGDRWSTDINGAAAELAVAKLLNKHWGAHVSHGKAPDVDKYQVRSTTHKDGSLLLRPGDLPTEIFILVTVDMPRFDVAGYIIGADGMTEEFHKRDSKGESWWISQDRLYDVQHLINSI